MQLSIKAYLYVRDKEVIMARYAEAIEQGDIGLREGPQTFSHIELAEDDCLLIPWRVGADHTLRSDGLGLEVYLIGTSIDSEPTP